MSAPFERVAIVGVGLIGGSLGLAIKRSYPNVEVIGVDRAERTLEIAQARGAIDTGSMELSRGVGGADLIFVATPVRTIAELLPTLGTLIRPDALVTDVGSTKARICQIAEEFLPSRFIGGHPMTGSERPGIEAADPLLFENALYMLSPSVSARSEHLERLSKFLEGLGARVLFLDPEQHDQIVAYVSHLPQLLAVTLADLVAQHNQRDALYAALAAGGFRDMTRIAASPYEIWYDIIRENARNVEQALDELIKQLNTLKRQVRTRTAEELALRFHRAADFRNTIPRTGKGFLTPLYRVALSAPDRLGVLAHCTTAIARAGINIKDIELLKVRENVGGTFHLYFESVEAAERAASILSTEGYQSYLID
jgi:prephenate dehydrogenase